MAWTLGTQNGIFAPVSVIPTFFIAEPSRFSSPFTQQLLLRILLVPHVVFGSYSSSLLSAFSPLLLHFPFSHSLFPPHSLSISSVVLHDISSPSPLFTFLPYPRALPSALHYLHIPPSHLENVPLSRDVICSSRVGIRPRRVNRSPDGQRPGMSPAARPPAMTPLPRSSRRWGPLASLLISRRSRQRLASAPAPIGAATRLMSRRADVQCTTLADPERLSVWIGHCLRIHEQTKSKVSDG